MNKKIQLLICENRDYILFEYAKTLLDISWNRQVSGMQCWHEHTRRSIWYMRREMIKQALKTDCTHVLFLDTDVLPPPDFISKLAEHNLPMVSGYYCDTTGKPAVKKDGKPYIGQGLVAVETFSMGLSLIAREVLEKVEYPEPVPAYKLDGDAEFCANAIKAGFQPHVDFNVRGHHLLLGIF